MVVGHHAFLPPPPLDHSPQAERDAKLGSLPISLSLSFSRILSLSLSVSLSLPGGDEKMSLCLTSSLSPNLSRHLSFSFVLSLPLSFTHLPSLSLPF